MKQTIDTGDTVLLVATVVDAYADEELERGCRAADYAAGDFPQGIYGARHLCRHNDEAGAGAGDTLQRA